MNAVIEAIKARRSVRAYQDRPVPQETIEAIIDAGNWAPTGNNQQHWRFVVVTSSEFIDRLTAAALPTYRKVCSALMQSQDTHLREYFVEFFPRCLGWPMQPYEQTLGQAREMDTGIYWGAPVIVFVIGPPLDECTLVCANMMLAAHALGLGSCIVGFGAQVMDDPEIVAALEIRGAEKIHGPIAFGYPRIVPEAPPKKPPVVKWI